MDNSQIKEKIFEYVSQRKHVSFIELMNYFPDESGSGDFCLKYETIIVWVGMSENIIQAVQDLVKEHKIYLHPATSLTYLADGGGLKLPLVKEDRKYSKPHWLPMTLDVTPV
jgi:hypothetical protein